jgi:butyryl-CoA dehydrogenase
MSITAILFRKTPRQIGFRKDPTKSPTLIINHADVQRMLFIQKSISEGSLSLAMECNKLYDQVHGSTGEIRENFLLLLEILTPIVKTYASEQGSRSAALAIQTLGGYGFTTDFPVQQLSSLEIMSLYEGTTGIQSLDLLGRKVTMQNGKALKLLMLSIGKDINASKEFENLVPYALELEKELKSMGNVLEHLSGYVFKSKFGKISCRCYRLYGNGWSYYHRLAMAENGNCCYSKNSSVQLCYQ